MKVYESFLMANVALNRMVEEGMKVGIIRKYRIQAWVDFRPGKDGKGVVYSVEPVKQKSDKISTEVKDA